LATVCKIQLTLSDALSLKKARFEGFGKAYNCYHKLFILCNTANYGVTMTLKFNAKKCPSIFFSTAGLMIMLMVTASLGLACAQAEDNASQAMISKDEASQKVIDTLVKNLTENSDLKMGLRVNQYPDLLDANTEVGEASTDETMPSRVLVCQNASWLFFLDLAPGAHFAHPATIAVLDAVSGEIQTMDAQWWPALAEPVFDDETQRRDPETIIFEMEPNL
jgi:hypothetical protein